MYNILELQDMPMEDLKTIASGHNIEECEGFKTLHKQLLIYAILEAQQNNK